MPIGTGAMCFTSDLVFEELNYGWHQMYADEGFWNSPIPEGVDPWNLRGRS
jgi:hypothetical protein